MIENPKSFYDFVKLELSIYVHSEIKINDFQ